MDVCYGSLLPESARPRHPLSSTPRRFLGRSNRTLGCPQIVRNRHSVPNGRCPGCTQQRTSLLTLLLSGSGRVGMWRGGGRIGLSVSAPFVWRCLNGRATYSVSTPRSSNRTGAINASSSRTRHHAFAHGRSRAAIRPTARAVVPQRTPIDVVDEEGAKTLETTLHKSIYAEVRIIRT